MRASPIKFLIATDIHLGHSESHQELGNDSFEAFDEVLRKAKETEVDFLLLGGDLFDQVNPSQKCLYKCLNSLKESIFGSRQLDIQVQGIEPNFSSDNLNVSLPIFTIHGNHDYPSNDFGKLSVCDLLHASNYVNYFGKYNLQGERGNKKIKVAPIIFNKPGGKDGEKLAIFGLGYIKDLRLHKMLQDGLVLFDKPPGRCASILILHQNRWKGKKGGVGASYENCVLAKHLPEWMDLIVWCHQHEAIDHIEVENNRKIYQPGSTVITSYIEAQAKMKQCLLITVMTNPQDQSNLMISSIPLQTSHRPLIIRQYSLEQIARSRACVNDSIEQFFDNYFDQQLRNLINQVSSPKVPIIRLKIDYTNFQMIRVIRLEQKYAKQVANSNKIFKFWQRKVKPREKTTEHDDKQVLDMVRNGMIPVHSTREVDTTAQILQKFENEMMAGKASLKLFDMDYLKEKIHDLSTNKITLTGIKRSFQEELQVRCSAVTQQYLHFDHQQKEIFNKAKNSLLQKKNDAQAGKIDASQLHSIRLVYDNMIQKYRRDEQQKEEQAKSTFQPQKPQLTQTRESSLSQGNSRKAITSNKSKNPSLSSIINESNEYWDQQPQVQNHQSDEEDCCERANKQQFLEMNAVQNFQSAQRMANDTQSYKRSEGHKAKKKQVRFKQ